VERSWCFAFQIAPTELYFNVYVATCFVQCLIASRKVWSGCDNKVDNESKIVNQRLELFEHLIVACDEVDDHRKSAS
jgi:hypothetical protein